MLATFTACQPIVPMTTTVGAFNLKSLLSLYSNVIQVLNSILFFYKLLQSLLTTKARRSKEIFCHIIIVLFKSLLSKRKNAAVNCHKLTTCCIIACMYGVTLSLWYTSMKSRTHCFAPCLNSSITDVDNASAGFENSIFNSSNPVQRC